MGDESISFFKMNFNQKVQVATQRLQAQGKEATTANIVKEMVSMANAEKANGDTPIQGYAIEHTEGAAAARRAGEIGYAGDVVINVYGVPNIPGGNIPQDVMKFLDFIMELLPQLENMPPQFKDDLIEVLTEYVDKLENPDVQEQPREVYGTPDILKDEKVKKMLDFLSKLSNLNLPQDALNEITSLLNDYMSGDLMADETEIRGRIADILLNASVSNEQVNEILNSDSLISLTTVEMIYGTPETMGQNTLDTENIQKLLDIAKQLQNMNLPSDLVSGILQELANAMQNEETGSYIEVLDKITAKIKEANLSDEQEAELMNAISNLLNEINSDVATSVCLYGSPNIPSFKDIIAKFLPDINSLSEEWKGTLATLVKTVITFLQESTASGIEETKTEQNSKETVKPIIKTMASGKKILVVPRYDNEGNIINYVDLGGRTFEKNAFRD